MVGSLGSGTSVGADRAVGGDEVVRLEPVFAFEDVARQVVHEVDNPDGFVFGAVAGLVFGAGRDAHGEFEAPAAVFGVGAFGVEVEFAHAVGDEVAVEGLFVAVVDAGAVQRVFAAGSVFDDAGVVARLKVAIEGFEGGVNGVPADGVVFVVLGAVLVFGHGVLRWVGFLVCRGLAICFGCGRYAVCSLPPPHPSPTGEGAVW